VLVHFEAGSTHEAVKLIKKMSQRDLQAKFKLVS
jgi:pentatricopeptide repeat protein